MKMKALVTYEKNGPFVLDEIDLDPPQAGEVLVRVEACGLCHTDLLAKEKDDDNPFKDIPLPMVLGHEGAGVVVETGPGVDYCKVGDHVVLTYNSCGQCEGCCSGDTGTCDVFFKYNFTGIQMGGGTRLHKDGKPVSTFFGQSSFAHYAVTNQSNTVVVPKDVPLAMLGPLGCGIQAGSGAVLYRLHPTPGDSIAVFGCGSVGLSALLAAKAAGCTTIIAVDVHESRLELAKTLGATHTINGGVCDTVEAVHKICSIGVHYAVETTGSGKVLSQSLYSLRPGGTTCVIGTGSKEVTFEVEAIRGERTITGIVEGTVNPHIQIPRLVELYKNGLFPFDSFISYYDMADIHKAMEDTAKGTAIKAVIRMN